MSKPLRIIFAGTPVFAVPPLSELLRSQYRVISVYTQPDRPSGRGRRLTASPVKQLALQHGIPVFQPPNFKSADDIGQLDAQRPDLMIVAAYGLILPEPVLSAPRLGCVNIHASLLPRWRGAAPIQRAILAGDEESGITIMQMEKGLDTGPMYSRLHCTIGPEETGGELHDRLSSLGAQALMEALPGILSGDLKPEIQDDAGATYAPKLEKAEAAIDWSEPATLIGRKVRAFNPWPVAYGTFRGDALRIWDALVIDQDSRDLPGTVLASTKEGIDVATGEGVLRIRRLQLPGKREMSAADFINAHDLGGVVFG